MYYQQQCCKVTANCIKKAWPSSQETFRCVRPTWQYSNGGQGGQSENRPIPKPQIIELTPDFQKKVIEIHWNFQGNVHLEPPILYILQLQILSKKELDIQKTPTWLQVFEVFKE